MENKSTGGSGRRNNNTLVEIWNNPAADQDGAALLRSAADETYFQSLIQDDTTIDKAALGQEKREIAHACTKAVEKTDINAEIITSIEKAMLKHLTQQAQNDNPSEQDMKKCVIQVNYQSILYFV